MDKGITPAEHSKFEFAKLNSGIPPMREVGLNAIALRLRKAVLSIIPIKTDGSKQPAVSWKRYQTTLPSDDDLQKWFGNSKQHGIALIGGKVSGNLEILGFDAPELIDEWRELVEESAPGLLARLPQVETPSSGLHVFYRCAVLAGNQKLAEREIDVAEGTRGARPRDGRWYKVKTTIETRGEGGYVVTVGSPAACHPSGKPYKLINGDLTAVPTITEREREMLLDCARSFNEHVKQAPRPKRKESKEPSSFKLRPGDDFNQRGDVRALLEKHDWKYLRKGPRGELWQRPGGDHTSATLFSDRSLYVFSSNAHPFDHSCRYDPFSIYSLLEHSGDWKAAAKALALAGYGAPLKKSEAKVNSQPASEPQQEKAAGEGEWKQTGNGEIADLSIFDGDITLKFKKASRGRVSVEAYGKNVLIHQDTIDLGRDEQRTQFLKKLAKKANRNAKDVEAAETALLQKVGEIEEALEEEQKIPAKKVFDPAEVYNPYEVREGKLIYLKPIIGSHELDGITQPITLTNFTAQIVGTVLRDDGTEPIQVFEVEVKIVGENLCKGTVKTVEFSAMRWPVAIAGARAVIYAGKIEHARAAIQLISEHVEARRVVAHTGWRKENGEWLFFHADGAIGAKGLIDADVELPPALTPCALPAPPTGERLREVVRAVAFDLPKVAPDPIMLPLIGCVFVAALTGGDFSLFLLGTTGKGKTELLILAQSFFGSSFDEKHIPANWGSTAYSIQGIAHLAKDIICGVDDFVPKGTQIEQAKLHAKAETVLRGQANSSGRARCNPDGSVRPERPPRGVIISTGEDIPRGQSLVARLLASEVKEGDVDWTQLTACQDQRRQGVYAEATSAFLQWLAVDSRIEELQKKAADKIHLLRTGWSKAGLSVHKKVANTLAQIDRAWGVWLNFAVECGAIDDDESARIYEAVLNALDAAGREQARFLAGDNPATRFIDLLKAALSSGRAHIAATADNLAPEDAATWGWQQKPYQVSDEMRSDWTPQGDRIGWISGDDVYLQPDSAYRVAQSVGVNGEGLAISSQTLWKRLREENVLASKEESRESNKIRKTICGKPETVLHLKTSVFFPP
jgi:hypothetical protein